MFIVKIFVPENELPCQHENEGDLGKGQSDATLLSRRSHSASSQSHLFVLDPSSQISTAESGISQHPILSSRDDFLDHEPSKDAPDSENPGAHNWPSSELENRFTRAGVSRFLDQVTPNSSISGILAGQSYLPSFQDLPLLEHLVSDDEISRMSAQELQDVVSQLKTELQLALVQNDILRKELQQMADNMDSGTGVAKERATTVAEVQTDDTLLINGHGSDVLSRDTEKEATIAELQKQMQHLENLNQLLKRQIELDSCAGGTDTPGFNPQLIVDMAKKIEELKAEVTDLRDGDKEGKSQGKRSKLGDQLNTHTAFNMVAHLCYQ